MTVGPSLDPSLKHLDHHWRVASLIVFYSVLVDVHFNWVNWFHFHILNWEIQSLLQGLIEKHNIDIDGGKGNQIGIVIMYSIQAICYIYFSFSSLLCSHYVINVIKKLELQILIV